MIKNTIAVVTGSGQGLGRAFAKNLLKEGARVCISDLNAVTGLATVNSLRSEFGQDRVHFIKCDVTKLDELNGLYDGTEDFFKGKVNLFCNNAGVGPRLGNRLLIHRLDITLKGPVHGKIKFSQ